MIGIVIAAFLLVTSGLLLWFVILPAISLITTQLSGVARNISGMIKTQTSDQNLTAAVDSFIQGLDFQANAFMWLAQYGWIVITLAFFLGVFMMVRRWVEFERGGRIA